MTTPQGGRISDVLVVEALRLEGYDNRHRIGHIHFEVVEALRLEGYDNSAHLAFQAKQVVEACH